jgi:hypothetical protein
MRDGVSGASSIMEKVMRLGKTFHRLRKSPLYPVLGIIVGEIVLRVLNSRRLKRLETALARRARA